MPSLDIISNDSPPLVGHISTRLMSALRSSLDENVFLNISLSSVTVIFVLMKIKAINADAKTKGTDAMRA